MFECGFAKNKIMEFFGDGVASLPIEYRNGIDVMTTETACLSSVWATDDETKAYLELHGRSGDYRKLSPADGAGYDGVLEVNLSEIEPMIALHMRSARSSRSPSAFSARRVSSSCCPRYMTALCGSTRAL